MEVRFAIFRSSQTSWEGIMQRAADFASNLPADRVIGISQSCDSGDSLVTVWYRADIKSPPLEPRMVFC